MIKQYISFNLKIDTIYIPTFLIEYNADKDAEGKIDFSKPGGVILNAARTTPLDPPRKLDLR